MNTNTTAMNAAQNLMSARQQMKALEDFEAKLRNEFAATIFMDAIENPSRVTQLGAYWRMTGLLPTDVARMVDDLIKTTDNPDFMGLKATRAPITRRYAEFDEQGNPTGKYIKRTEEVSVIINLGAVKPPRSGEGWKMDPVLGADSLLDKAPMCKTRQCYYKQRNQECPEKPGNKWKCYTNWPTVQKLIDDILARL